MRVTKDNLTSQLRYGGSSDGTVETKFMTDMLDSVAMKGDAFRTTVLIDGDSITAGALNKTLLPSVAPMWWSVAHGLLHAPVTIVGLAAYGGKTIQNCVDDFNQYVRPYNPDEIWIQIGRNNVSSTSVANTALAYYDQYLDLADSVGARVTFCTVAPATGGTYWSSVIQQATQIINNYLWKLQLQGRCDIVDTASAITDFTSATGDILSTHVGADNLRPNPRGQQAMGVVFYNAKSGKYHSKTFIPNNPLDVRTSTNKNSINLVKNPYFQGSGGSSSGAGTPSGSIPTNWSTTIPSGMTDTITLVQDTSGSVPLTWTKHVLTGTTVAGDFVIGASTDGLTALDLAPNGTRKIGARMRIKLVNPASNCVSLAMYLQLYNATYGATTMNASWFTQTGVSHALYAAGEYTLEIPPFVYAATSEYPNFFLDLTVGAGNINSTEIWVSKPTVYVI